MGEVLDAAQAITRRKSAIYGDGDDVAVTPGMSRRMFVGMDLDYDEAVGVGHLIAHQLAGVLDDDTLCPALTGMWVDGLATGILLAERRDRATPLAGGDGLERLIDGIRVETERQLRRLREDVAAGRITLEQLTSGRRAIELTFRAEPSALMRPDRGGRR